MSHDRILLAHGGGGALTKSLIEDHIVARLSNEALDPLTDGAIIANQPGRLCLSTDASVVHPIFFPGGDIGRLAVCGTVNDLAMMGAQAAALTMTLILEEGLSFEVLDQVLDSIAATAAEAKVAVVAGDTKVVERRNGDGLFISTSGVGFLAPGLELGPKQIQPGDQIIVSGRIAEHGLAIMATREGLALQTSIESDVAPIAGLARELHALGQGLRFLRDPTRGGLAGVAVDIAEDTQHTVLLHEQQLPMSAAARHLAEALGLDPLSVANEGKLVAVVSAAQAQRALELLRAHPQGREAAIVGEVLDRQPAMVELQTRAGGRRVVQRPYGEDLPRIC